ncbi:hypothetical protein Q7P37_008493 [Cladosporium fusiforme]
MSGAGSDERAWSRTPSPFKDPDAGLKGVDHYQTRLPPWRYHLRQYLIPVVRLETPSLAAVQTTCRSPVLDSYFAMTANLGTHTFFMAALPICFWCGYPGVGIALVHMLALGVYWSGYVKDLLCLPRPLSPPLQRITMSGSAALEYGFPSTHTTNAVSVALFCLYQLQGAKDDMSSSIYSFMTWAFYCYAISISIGRIYCGMHGWFDVVFGGLLGALITWLRVTLGPAIDAWIISGDWQRPALAVVVLGLAVRFHPEPADNCPCFDDSVAFIGVVMGIEIGLWHYSSGNLAALDNMSAKDWTETTREDFGRGVAKVVIGILIIFLWRAVMKPLCLQFLPPIFRFVDHWGFRLPRRYFLQARYYKSVPTLRKDDNVLPPASEIPSLLSKTRKRTISVGPQSEADVREYIANREQKRRDSISSATATGKTSRNAVSDSMLDTSTKSDGLVSPKRFGETPDGFLSPSTSFATRQHVQTSLSPPSKADALGQEPPTPTSSDSGKEDEQQDRKLFSALEKPRIRYDVEVITKLVVYAGIAWLAVEGNPLFFTWLGLA